MAVLPPIQSYRALSKIPRPVAVSGLLGVPGHSYVVPRVHARVPGTPATKHRSSLGGTDVTGRWD